MPTFENTPRGNVVSIWGKAYIRGTDGVWRPLKLGELIKPGDALLTEQNAIVQMSDGKGEPVPLVASGNDVERAITALEQGERDAAPAAGLAGGGGGDLQPGLRVDRVVESITASGPAARLDSTAFAAGIATQSNPAGASNAAGVSAPSSAIGALEDSAPVGLGLGAPTGGGTLVVTVTQVPTIGQIVRADGTPVATGATLAPSDLAGLRYIPPADYDGVAPVGGFGFNVSNGTSSASGGTQIALTAVNDAPLATPGNANGAEDVLIGVSLIGSDTDGTIASVQVAALPSDGTLLLADGVTAVLANQALTPAQAAGLLFRPDADFNGNASLAFSVTDNGGAVSSPAAFAIAVAAVNDVPVAIGDTVSTVGTLPVTVAVLANDIDVDGDTLVVSGASVDAALGSVVINSDGSLGFSAAAGVSGPVVVTYTVADPSGATATATLTVQVAAAPSVTVDGPALTNDNTPTITGTSNLPPGSSVALTVTDANGAVQSFSATVQADGSYAADVPVALADGPYGASATVTVSAGLSASASDGGSVDTAVPAVTVDAPALGNDSTPTITGSTDLPAGSTVVLTVTGTNGAVQSFSATVQAGGSYSADVPSALVDGGYSVVALATDAAGNTGSASDSGLLDTTPPSLTVDAPALTNDSTPTITGSTDLPAGSTVTLTVTDANGAVQNFTATVQPGGSYSADVPSALAEGSYTVAASTSDAAGNSASANDGGAIDLTAPAGSISIDPVTADNIVNAGEAGGTVTLTGAVGGDVQPGDTVTLVVNGNAYIGLVQAGDLFSIAVAGSDVLADPDRRIDASVTITDAAGNSATATAIRDYAVNTAPVAVADALAVGEDAASVAGDATPGSPGQDSDADGDAITVTGVATGALPSAAGNVGSPLAGSWGTLTLNADGSYSYAPAAAAQALDAGQTVTDTFTYTIDDGRGGSATATLTLSVVGADDPTTISGTLTGAVQEDAVASASGTLSATDPDVGTRAFVAQSGSAGAYGSFSIDAAGNWSYSLANAAANVQALAAGQSVTETFVVAADDGTSASVTVTVSGSNDAPVVSNTAISAVEEGAAVGLGLAVPSDVDAGALLTITVTGLPTIGQVQLADGTPVANGATLTAAQLAGLRYLPPAEYDGVAAVGSFAYSVSDGVATVAGGTSITLAAVNDLPVALDASAGTGENAVLSSSVPAASDADGTVASYALVTGPSSGSLSFNSDGSYVFAPGTAFDDLAAGAARQVSFSYTATDNGSGVSAPATVTITVTGTNDGPVASDTSASTGENTVLNASVPAATDVDGTVASYALVSGVGAGNGSLAFNADGSYVFSPGTSFDDLAVGATRQVSFTYTATDNNGAISAPATVTITVTGTNDAPVASNASASTGENTVLNASVPAATDVDGTVASYALVSGVGAGNGSLAFNADGSYVFNPGTSFDDLAVGATRQVSFTYTATDNSGAVSAPATVTITVTGTNDGPVAVDDGSALAPALTVAEDSGSSAPIAVLANDSDADGDPLTVTIASSPNGTVTINPDNTLVFTPAANFNGTATISYTVSDGQGGTSTATAFIAVTPVNDAPVNTLPAMQITAEDSAVVFSTANGNAISIGDIDAGSSAILSVMLTATHGTLTLGSTAGVTVGGDGSVSVTLSGTQAAINAALAGTTFQPNADFNGGAMVVVVVNDNGNTGSGGMLFDTDAIPILVMPVNDAPVAGNAGASTGENTVLNASVPAASDVDGTIAGYALVTGVGAGNGTLAFNADGSYVFNPGTHFDDLAVGATRQVNFTYTATDNQGAVSAPATVTITVTGTNDAPVASDTSAGTGENAVLDASVPAASDVDGTVASYALATGLGAGNGSLSFSSSGAYTFTPGSDFDSLAPGATRQVSFTYTATDNDGGVSAPATVTITVTGTNDAPVITSDGGGSIAAVSVAENTSAVTTVTASDVDAGQTLGYSIVGGADAARFAINPTTGALAFVSAPDFEAPTDADGNNVYVVQVEVSDGNGGTQLQTINVTVTDVNESPVGSADSAIRVEGGNGSGFLDVLANDSDPEGGALTVAQVATSAAGTAIAADGITSIATALGGTVVMNTDGSFRYIAPAVTHDAGNTPVADSFAYRASDGVNAGAWTTVTLSLTDTAPTAVADSADVAFNSSVSGNLLANDSAVDGAIRVSQFTQGATTVSVPNGGSASIDTAGGLLTVNSDGSYTYASQLPSVKVLTGSSLATWEDSTNLYGFTSGSALSGGNLDLSALTPSRSAQAVFVSGAKNGIGVGTSGSGTIGSSETLVMNMLETTTQVTIGIAQLNANQDPANAQWAAYAADGTLVTSGTFASATSVSSGTEYTLDITNAQPFQYITLQWANNSQGFVLSSLDLTRNPTNYVETFSVVTTDADGDTASASLTVTPAAASNGGSTTSNGTASDDTLSGSEAANTINGLGGHDALRGFGGADTLDGGDGVDLLDGGSADDVLSGGNGNDFLRGGADNDALTGGSGADTFQWQLADRGTGGSPAIDTVADFDSTGATGGGDILDLRDLLQGETTSATLDHYLDFSVSGGNTTIRISSTGAFTDGGYAAGAEDQRIVLSGVDIRASLGLAGSATDTQIISELINRGKLLTDVPAGS